jgi:hypothetical protein
MIARAAIFILLALTVQPLQASELLNSFVNKDGEHYIIHLDMRIDADYDSVYEVLTDFSLMGQVNDSITHSELRESEGKKHLVFFVNEGCIWFICRKVRQLVTVSELGRGYILSEVQPEESDLSYGRVLWQLIDEGETTRVKYNADIVPDFWIPPFFGSNTFQKRMLEEGKKTVNGLEQLSSTLGINNE